MVFELFFYCVTVQAKNNVLYCKWIYERSCIWTAEKDMNVWLIIAVMYTTWAVVKLKPEKKFRPERDPNPWPLWYRCSALSTESMIKPSGSWSHFKVRSITVEGEECKWIHNCSRHSTTRYRLYHKAAHMSTRPESDRVHSQADWVRSPPEPEMSARRMISNTGRKRFTGARGLNVGKQTRSDPMETVRPGRSPSDSPEVSWRETENISQPWGQTSALHMKYTSPAIAISHAHVKFIVLKNKRYTWNKRS